MKFDLHALFSTRYVQWINIALILFFSILIITDWFTLFLSPVTTQSVSETPKELPVMEKKSTSDGVLHSPLFGVYVSNISNDLSGVKKSMLNANLVGILFAAEMDDSQVIIQSANEEEKTYKFGDIIPGGAVIKRIMASGVLVEREGAIESLSLSKNELIFEPMAKPLKKE